MLLSSVPRRVLVDMTHGITPGDIRSAAYVLGRTWHRFPRRHRPPRGGGSGGRHHPRRAGPWRTRPLFAGPDNGVFTPVLRDTAVEVVALPTPDAARRRSTGAISLPRGGGPGPRRHSIAGAAVRRDAPAAGVHRAALRGEDSGGRGGLRGSVRQPDHQSHDRAGAELRDVEVEELDSARCGGPLATSRRRGCWRISAPDGAVEIAVRDGSAARRLGVGVGGRVRARLD